MKSVYSFLLKMIFEKLPILNLLNGFKTQIGKILEFVSAIIIMLQQSGLDIPYLDTVNGWVIFLSGLMIKYLGEAHSANKVMRGVDQ